MGEELGIKPRRKTLCDPENVHFLLLLLSLGTWEKRKNPPVGSHPNGLEGLIRKDYALMGVFMKDIECW